MKPMEYRGFIGTIECDMENNVLHGKLFGIKDLVTYEAQTPASLWDEFRAAVDDYLKDCRELGRDPDRPCKGSFNVRVLPELHRELYLSAVDHGMTLNEYVHITLRAHNVKGHTVTFVEVPSYHWKASFGGHSRDARPAILSTKYHSSGVTASMLAVASRDLH